MKITKQELDISIVNEIESINDKISVSEKGVANGIATLDDNGKVSQSQIDVDTTEIEQNLTNLQKVVTAHNSDDTIHVGKYLITPTSNNCNDLLESGFYQVGSDSLNVPKANAGFFKWAIQVMSYYIEGEAGATVLQIAYDFNSSGTYIRRRARSGLWTDWEIRVNTGYGSPEGVITATIGSLYVNSSGGLNSTLYVKTSGFGNTGWTAK